jgi:glycosyltransferase involved in cell wall biosynthesis
VGNKAVSELQCFELALEQHRWIPSLSHDEVLSLMREHDVFIFFTFFEGFGLVITEAMSQGVPVVTTDRTAGLILKRWSDVLDCCDSFFPTIKEVLLNILDNPELIEKG